MIIKAKEFAKLLYKKGTVFNLDNDSDISYITMDSKLNKVKNLKNGLVMVLPNHFLDLNGGNINIIDHPKKDVYMIKNTYNNMFITQYQTHYSSIDKINYGSSFPSVNSCVNSIITFFGDMPYSIKNLEILKIDSISNEVLEVDKTTCQKIKKILENKIAPTARYIKDQYARNMVDHVMVHLVDIKKMKNKNINDFDCVEKIHSNSTGTFIRFSYTDDINERYENLLYLALKLDITDLKKVNLYSCKNESITKLEDRKQ